MKRGKLDHSIFWTLQFKNKIIWVIRKVLSAHHPIFNACAFKFVKKCRNINIQDDITMYYSNDDYGLAERTT